MVEYRAFKWLFLKPHKLRVFGWRGKYNRENGFLFLNITNSCHYNSRVVEVSIENSV